MFDFKENNNDSTLDKLISSGYWPALALPFLKDKKYSKVVEICREQIKKNDAPISGKLIYAKALYYAKQFESATKILTEILAEDSECITALQYLGHIKFKQNDSFGAISLYEKIFEINPNYQSLFQEIPTTNHNEITTTTITLKKPAESITPETPLRNIPFYTETMGELYNEQGHFRLAQEVFEKLNINSNNTKFENRIREIENKIDAKEKANVKKKN